MTLLAFATHGASEDLPKINLLADPSLSVAISTIARDFSREQGIAITTSFAPAREQSDNIIEGFEADVFITARKRSLDALKRQGLLDVYSQKPVTKNRLSMVTRANNELELILIPKLPLQSILKRLEPNFTFTIGDPSFQNSGYFALKALRNYEMAAELEPHFLFVRSSIDVHRTIEAPGGYGLMYRSEAVRNPKLKILGTFPEVAHSPILYYGVVVAGEHMTSARQFLDYLASDAAQKVFQSYGFESLMTFKDEGGQLAAVY